MAALHLQQKRFEEGSDQSHWMHSSVSWDSSALGIEPL